MSAPPRYHAGKRWEQKSAEDIRAVARTLARLLRDENRYSEWRDAGWQRHCPRGRFPRSAPRRYNRSPRWPPRTPEGLKWWPRLYGDERRGRQWQMEALRANPWDSWSRTQPRRGPPVAVMKVPRRYQHDEWEKRQSGVSELQGA